MNKNKTYPFYYLLGIILVIIAAWWRYFSTGSIKVDNNAITTWELYPILLLFFSGIALNFLGYVRIIQTPSFDFQKIKHLAMMAILIAMLMPPMLSNDVMLYLANGDLMNQGIVTYVDPSGIQSSKFVENVAPVWLDCPNHYGPFLMMIFGASVWVGKSLIGSLIVYKILVSISAYIFVRLVFSFLEKQKIKFRKYNVTALLTLAPIIWLQAVGQMHADGIIMTLIMGMIYFLFEKKWALAAILTSFILMSKIMYTVVFIPFFIVFLWFRLEKNWEAFLKKSFLSLSIITIFSVGFYAPFWEGAATLTTAIEYHENKPPSRSHVEVLTDVIFYGKKIFAKDEALDLGRLAKEDEQLHNNKLTISKPLTSFFKFFGIFIAGWVFLSLAFIKNHTSVLPVFGKILLVVLCFYSPIFHPWYFLLVLPFFIFTEEKSWMIFVAVVFSFSNLHEIAFSIPKSSPLYLVSLIFVLLMVLSFFIFFKKHFIQETWQQIRGNENPLSK